MNHLNQEGTVYDPLSVPYNYKYNGKELQETGFYDYGWRQYMPDIARWNGMDQLSESYASHSPYAYVKNNPIMFFDPDGRITTDWLNTLYNMSASGGSTTYTNFSSDGNWANKSFDPMENGGVSDFYNFVSRGGTGNYTYWTGGAMTTGGYTVGSDGLRERGIQGLVGHNIDIAGEFSNLFSTTETVQYSQEMLSSPYNLFFSSKEGAHTTKGTSSTFTFNKIFDVNNKNIGGGAELNIVNNTILGELTYDGLKIGAQSTIGNNTFGLSGTIASDIISSEISFNGSRKISDGNNVCNFIDKSLGIKLPGILLIYVATQVGGLVLAL